MYAVTSYHSVPVLNEDGTISYQRKKTVYSSSQPWWSKEASVEIKRMSKLVHKNAKKYVRVYELTASILTEMIDNIDPILLSRIVSETVNETKWERHISLAAKAAAKYLVAKGIDPSPIRYIVKKYVARDAAARIGRAVMEIKAKARKRLVHHGLNKVLEVFGFKWYVIARIALQGKSPRAAMAIIEYIKAWYDGRDPPLIRDLREKYGIKVGIKLKTIEEVLKKLGVPYIRYKYAIVVDREVLRERIDRAVEEFVKNI